MKKLYKRLGAKRFFTFAFSAVTVLALALVLTFSLLPSGITHIDITKSKRYTLSAESVQTAKSVKEEINVYLIASAKNESKDTLTALQRYESKSSKINVKTLYAETDKSFISRFVTYSERVNGGIIVEGARRSLYVPAHLLVSYSEQARNYAMQVYNSYYLSGETELSFSEFVTYYGEQLGLYDGYCLESRINAAIRYVTSDDVKTVYFASGSPSEYFSDALMLRFASNMTELKSLSLGSQGVPSDADAIMLMPVQADITSDELSALTAYLDEGGSVMLMSSYGVNTYKNLASLCSRFGISASSSYVFEDNLSYYYTSQETLLPDVSDAAIADALSEKQTVILPLCNEIKLSQTLPEGVSVKTLLSSSAESYVKTDFSKGYAFDETTDTRGARALGVKATNAQGGALTYIATSLLLVDDFDYYSNDGNKSAFFSILNRITESAPQNASPEPTAVEQAYFTATEGMLYGFIGVGAVLVLGVLAIGIIGGFKRNK